MVATTRDWILSRGMILGIVIFTILTLAIGVASGIGTISNNRHTARITACNASYNIASQRATAARAELSNEQIASTIKAIDSVAIATTPAEVKTALAQFHATQHEIAVEKASHPVPPIPSGDECK